MNAGYEPSEGTDSNEGNYMAQLDFLQGQVEQLRAMFGKNQCKEVNSVDKSEHMAGISYSSFSSSKILSASILSAPKSLASSTSLVSSWIIDSGDTDHMCNDLRIMHYIHHIHRPVYVTLPTGESVKVTMLGSVDLSPALTLVDVLYTPSFKFNLLSVSKVTATTPCCIIFHSHSCDFQDLTMRTMIASGKEVGGLYNFKSHSFGGSTQKISSGIWHKRLGHPSSHVQKIIQSFDPSVVVDNNHCIFVPCLNNLNFHSQLVHIVVQPCFILFTVIYGVLIRLPPLPIVITSSPL